MPEQAPHHAAAMFTGAKRAGHITGLRCPQPGEAEEATMEQLRQALLARAFLHDDPDAYAAGVEAALAAVGAGALAPPQERPRTEGDGRSLTARG
jgi:hypothetical protein